MPPHPAAVVIFEIYKAVPLMPESIQEALKRLRGRGLVEQAPGMRYTYRRAPDAAPPDDRRVGNANKRGRGKRQRER